jgi:hypothetical protein
MTQAGSRSQLPNMRTISRQGNGRALTHTIGSDTKGKPGQNTAGPGERAIARDVAARPPRPTPQSFPVGFSAINLPDPTPAAHLLVATPAPSRTSGEFRCRAAFLELTRPANGPSPSLVDSYRADASRRQQTRACLHRFPDLAGAPTGARPRGIMRTLASSLETLETILEKGNIALTWRDIQTPMHDATADRTD